MHRVLYGRLAAPFLRLPPPGLTPDFDPNWVAAFLTVLESTPLRPAKGLFLRLPLPDLPSLMRSNFYRLRPETGTPLVLSWLWVEVGRWRIRRGQPCLPVLAAFMCPT